MMQLPRRFRALGWLVVAAAGSLLLPAAPAAAGPRATRVAELIRQLGSDDFFQREAASRALADVGPEALDAVEEAALNNEDPEVRSRAVALLAVWKKPLRERALATVKALRAGAGSDTEEEELFWLSLSRTKVKDADLACLRWVDEVRSLNLAGTDTTDAGLAHLKYLRHLESLRLNGTKVSDDGLKNLAGLKGLGLLDLSDTAVTDAGLKHLKPLTNLTGLIVVGSKVTPKGVAEFRKALPRLEIAGP